MSISERKKILSKVSAENFIGRTDEIDTLLRHAKGENQDKGMLVMSAPSLGLSELLRQTYDQLFYEQGETIPFYFQVKTSDKNAEQMATRFLQAFLQQTVAFRRNDTKIIDAFSDLSEVAQMAAPNDGHWIDRLVETIQLKNELNDENSFVRQALSSPLRAANYGAKVAVMIDDFENAGQLLSESNLIEELKSIYSRSNVPFMIAGKRRFVFKRTQSGTANLNESETIQIEPLSFNDAGLMVESLAEQYGIKITEQSRDLIVQQFQGIPSFIAAIFHTAAEKGFDLDTFQRVEQVYTAGLFGGKIKGMYDSVFKNIAPNVEVQKQIISLLYNALTVEKTKAPVESWKKHLDLNSEEFYPAMQLLNTNEIIRGSANMIETMDENSILSDYITARFRLELRSDPRSLVIAESLSSFLKRAPKTMAEFYRGKSSIGLRQLISVFDCQTVPVSLLDYNTFKEWHKGTESKEILEKAKTEKGKIQLPQMVYSTPTVSLYSPIGTLTETERSAVAVGFEGGNYKDENEVVWIAAEIDSKLEAEADLTQFWCDRLEMVAIMCDFRNYRLWLISPEGFSDEAIKILDERNAIGSSRRQVELLAAYINAEDFINEKLNPNEYEMVLPMGEDTELIAAYTVEEIARKHSFKPKAINQIKTALVEAYINAKEHSHSPDRKIHQKLTVEDDKIIITISNRGLRFKGKEMKEVKSDKGRRGWGLKLMESLMDDVKFEQVDDGTKISLTKFLENQPA